jgi:predicted DNA binding CopG/RHH family protein
MKKELKIPKFENEDEEAKFWDKVDFGEYFDEKDIQRGVVFPNLELSTEKVTIRFPKNVLLNVKKKARKANIPYQRLIKEYVRQGLTRDE